MSIEINQRGRQITPRKILSPHTLNQQLSPIYIYIFIYYPNDDAKRGGARIWMIYMCVCVAGFYGQSNLPDELKSNNRLLYYPHIAIDMCCARFINVRANSPYTRAQSLRCPEFLTMCVCARDLIARARHSRARVFG